MYQSAFTYRPRTVRFCQWSRKAYAAFASLKIQVTMGCVSKGNTGFMPPEEASRASGTEMPPLPAGLCLPEQEIHTPAAAPCPGFPGFIPLFCFALLSVIFIRHG